MLSIADSTIGPDHLWILGDNFASRSYRTHFKKRESTQFFIKHNYEFDAHCNSRWASANENMLSQIRNTFATAVGLQKTGLLPKYVLVVLDDNLISYLNFKREGMATLLGTWVEWLVKEMKDIVQQ